MSPCDVTLWLFRDGFLALTQDMQEWPHYTLHTIDPATYSLPHANVEGMMRFLWSDVLKQCALQGGA